MNKSSPGAGQVSTSKVVSEVKVHVGSQMVIRLAAGSLIPMYCIFGQLF